MVRGGKLVVVKSSEVFLINCCHAFCHQLHNQRYCYHCRTFVDLMVSDLVKVEDSYDQHCHHHHHHQVKVGDFVKVEDQQQIPADLILFSSALK